MYIMTPRKITLAGPWLRLCYTLSGLQQLMGQGEFPRLIVGASRLVSLQGITARKTIVFIKAPN